MVEVVNNTKEVKHLPYGNIALQPGLNEVDEKQLDRNKGHKGFEYDLKNGNIKIKSETKKPEEKEVINDKGNIDSEFPKSKGGGWYELSTGESVQGKEVAEEIQEKIDKGEL